MEDKRSHKVQYVVTDAGERVSVVMPVEEYDELMEDLADLAAIAERRNEGSTDHAAVIARLKADGLL